MDTRLTSVLLVLCLSIQIAACGGGNDTTSALGITAVSPGDGATGVQPSSQPTITFSAAVNPATVTATAITLTSGSGLQDSTASVSGNQITIKPKASLLSQTAYTLTVTTAIRGVDGELLSQSFVAHFSTLSYWGTPQVIGHSVAFPISNGGYAECAPQIGFDADGNALAAWSSAVPQARIYSNRYVSGVGWSSAQSFDLPQSSDNVLSMAVAANGNAFAVWTGAPNTIYASVYSVGSGWSVPGIVVADAGGSIFTYPPEVGTDSAGNGMIAWSQGGLQSSRYTNGSWSAPVVVMSGALTDSFSFAMNANGDAMALWLIGTQPFSVFASSYGPDNGWSTPQAINGAYEVAAQAGDEIGYPSVAIDSSGNAVAFWPFVQAPVGGGPPYANYYNAGGGWGTPQGLNTNIAQAGVSAVAVGGNGTALAVWSGSSSANATTEQFVNSYVPGQGWSSSVMLGTINDTNSPIWASAIFPSAAVDAQGNALVVWQGTPGVSSARYSPGTGWSDSISIDTPAGNGASPRVAIDSTGKALAVWCEAGTGNDLDIYANWFTPGP